MTDEFESAPYIPVTVHFPNAPSAAPKLGNSSLTSSRVLTACQRIREGWSPAAAFRTAGVNPSFSQWERQADEGTDPFYVWTVECIRLAEALAVGNAEGAIHKLAMDGNVKALQSIVSKRSTLYKETQAQQAGGGGNVSITIENLIQMIDRGVSPSQLQAHAFHKALPDHGTVIDAEIEEDEPVKVAKESKPAPSAFVFKRRPVTKENF